MRLLENINVLIAEDDEFARKITAGNGASALKVLKEKSVDLVFSDWEMPLFSGLRLLQAIRADRRLRTIKFIMLTASNEKEAILKASEQGVDDYVIKPVHVKIVAEKVKNCLERNDQLQMDLYHLDIGDFSQEKGDLDLAIDQYHQALGYNADNYRTHLSLGEAHHKKGNLKDALDSLEKSIQLNNRCARAHFSKSHVHVDLHQREEARAEFETAIELDPTDLKRCKIAANAFLEHGYVDEATSAFRIALDLDPKDVILYNKIGIALRKQGRGEEAILQYEKALKIQPEDPTLLFNLSKAYLSLERKKEAAQILQRVVRSKPDFKEAAELLAAI